MSDKISPSLFYEKGVYASSFTCVEFGTDIFFLANSSLFNLLEVIFAFQNSKHVDLQGPFYPKKIGWAVYLIGEKLNDKYKYFLMYGC